MTAASCVCYETYWWSRKSLISFLSLKHNKVDTFVSVPWKCTCDNLSIAGLGYLTIIAELKTFCLSS